MLLFEQNKKLSEFSTFGIGGPAKYFIEIDSPESTRLALEKCREDKIPYFVLGKGSNTLFSSKGFDGLILLNKISFLEIVSPFFGEASSSFENQKKFLKVGGGYSFSLLGAKTAKNNLTGLEFAAGIPGSVGGAVFMNAGANGQETADTLFSVDFLDDSGKVQTFLKEELHFAYRTSSFQQMKGMILSATFALTPCEKARKVQIEIINKRTKSQPYRDPSIGCIFRNPGNEKASRLIDQCGLKGLQIGDAKVSDLHANFIVNTKNATSEEVLTLIELIQLKVKEKTGFQLESEIRMIPYQI